MHWTNRFMASAALAASLAAGFHPTPALAQKDAQEEKDWWKNAVIYEIYPRSFQDTNNDGLGDINGITQRLDYLKELGVDAIWLTPCYPSPNADYGYDVADYKAISPEYGTMADFDKLMAEAQKRHIRIIMDMVMNHTSDQHKWFLESRSSKTNPYRDWYVWHDGKGQTATDKGTPINNWQSAFGHTAWQWDPKTSQYFYHKFYVGQPDLNWSNPKVHEAFKDILGFWEKKGVAGFRFDAITTLFEDPALRDEGVLKNKDGKPMTNPYGEPMLDDSMTDNLPQVHDVMAELRAHSDTFNSLKFPGTRVFIGETYLPNIAELAKQYGSAARPEFHLPMDTQIATINKMDAAIFRTKINEAETQLNGNTPLLLFTNHDQPRLDVRYGDGAHNGEIQRVIAAVLFTTRGATQFYYGDEIGMKTTPPERKEDVKDPVGVTFWPLYKGRDGERTPMQWDATQNAGFSKATSTWLPVPATYNTVNVAAEEKDPGSMLAWYKALIKLKKQVPALAQGSEEMLDKDNAKVLSWVRTLAGSPTVVVSVNFSAEPQTVALTVPGAKGELKTLLATAGQKEPASAGSIELAPFGVYIGEVK